MAALVKVAKFSVQLANKRPGILFTVVRNQYWNKDFKPGPIPKTPEERRKAAEKYGVHPERYEHYPDDGLGYGDYPKLPLVSGDSKDPYYPWDMPSVKRNYNEPIHMMNEVVNDTRFDVNYRHRIPIWKQFVVFISVMGFFIGTFVFLEDPAWKMHSPALAKQLPAHGKHYYFPEPEGTTTTHH